MIRTFSRTNGNIKIDTVSPDELAATERGGLLWIDLVNPQHDEILAVERQLEMELPTRQESEEIEFSARFWEDEKAITINTYFFFRDDQAAVNENISFTLRERVLVTTRYSHRRIFEDFTRRLLSSPSAFPDGLYVLAGLLDLRIDMDADILEALSKQIVGTGRQNINGVADHASFLDRVTTFEEINITFRENLTDKQRVLSSLLKSPKIPDSMKKEFAIMIKDVNSLITSANFNFERLDYLQDLFLNFMSVEQNKVIKIFTVMSVIFLPPTLIASVYGMNFRFLPELDWYFGYPMALILMALSAVLPIWIFRKKGWL